MMETTPSGPLVLPTSSRVSSLIPVLRRKHLTDTLRLFTRLGSELPPRLRPAHRRLCARVKDALARDAAAVLEVFALPNIGAPVRCFADRGRWPEISAAVESAMAGALVRLPLELSRRGLSPEPEPAGAGAEPEDLPLEGDILLSRSDANPLAATEDHPEKSGSRLDFGGRAPEEWQAALRQSLSAVHAALPELCAEMRLLLRRVVPVGHHAERHLSASYREAVGAVYLSLHPEALTMATALIHEFQHNKLYLASHSDPMLKNAFSPLYPSPVRPDPRPLWGVLLAVHAFLPVATLWRRLKKISHPLAKSSQFERRLREIDLKNNEGVSLLRAHGDWTAFGRDLLKDLEEMNARHLAELPEADARLFAYAHDD